MTANALILGTKQEFFYSSAILFMLSYEASQSHELWPKTLQRCHTKVFLNTHSFSFLPGSTDVWVRSYDQVSIIRDDADRSIGYSYISLIYKNFWKNGITLKLLVAKRNVLEKWRSQDDTSFKSLTSSLRHNYEKAAIRLRLVIYNCN